MSPDVDDLDAQAQQWSLEPVIAALAEDDADTPAPSTRARLLARVAAAPRRLPDPVAPSDLYASRADALRALLADLDADQWHRRAAPYEWSVHGLVAHLLVIEQYTASRFGLCDPPPGAEHDHLALGAEVIAAEQRDAPEHTAQRWSAAARSIADHATSPRFAADAPAPLHGWPFSSSSALVARAFELWTHTDDIRRATGRPDEHVPAGELRTMSSFSVGTLPFLLPRVAPDTAMQSTRIVLTGAGGGTFDIGGGGERRALLATDVVDYCRVVARRIAPHDLHCTIEGDHVLVGNLLAASSVFAV
ncbi:MAG: hypothetical protein JWM12_2955 [Ilumatobacteraceae bacterium]|nr:hypothetical protein [Ilumatobacteraceae bacterium]